MPSAESGGRAGWCSVLKPQWVSHQPPQNHHDSSLADLSSFFRFIGAFFPTLKGIYFVCFVYGFLLIPPVCSCFRMPGRLRARWWFWSAESAGVLHCRSDGTDRGRRSWTRPTSASSRRVRHLSFANLQFEIDAFK